MKIVVMYVLNKVVYSVKMKRYVKNVIIKMGIFSKIMDVRNAI